MKLYSEKIERKHLTGTDVTYRVTFETPVSSGTEYFDTRADATLFVVGKLAEILDGRSIAEYDFSS